LCVPVENITFKLYFVKILAVLLDNVVGGERNQSVLIGMQQTSGLWEFRGSVIASEAKQSLS